MSSKIRIAARLRPLLPDEINDDAVGVQKDDNGSFVTVVHPRDSSQHFKFPFSSCYGQNSNQDEIYNSDVKPLLDVVFSGVTVTVFAYGVTSSGKTHTIQGSKAQPGIIPRVVKDLLERTASFPNAQVSLSVSYMEIYKEDAYDLLVERESAPKLPIRENEAGQVFVAHLSSMSLSCVSDFEKIYSAATKRRSTGSTNLNRASSRSHAILTLYVKVADTAAGQTITGKINLVDLAGSENNKLTGNDPSRMAESSAINKSLSVLGQVVHALNQGASRIPYRNSKLTRILQDALGGTAVGLLICNLAPGAKFRQDTWNTLNFATRTKEIENKPVINIRETQPLPKPHFAALAPQQSRLPPANVPSSSGQSGRPSLLPTAGLSKLPTAGLSKLPGPMKGRVSSFGLSAAGTFQPFPSGPLGHDIRNQRSYGGVGIGLGMTEEEIDERISKAVELEVTRRLEERERQRQAEGKKDAERQQQAIQVQQQYNVTAPDLIMPEDTSLSSHQISSTSLPSGVLTPLLKRHEDLDNELKRRLVELEQKYEQSNKEAQLADVLSPASKKKTGRAYVALARAHSEKGNLQVALDLYRKARTYVPDNAKLKDRIIEIEYAVENDVDFVPQPKRKKPKAKKKGSAEGNSAVETLTTVSDAVDMDDHDGDLEDTTGMDNQGKGNGLRPTPFDEATNSPQKQKRVAKECDPEEQETPPKKQKKECVAQILDGDSDEE